MLDWLAKWWGPIAAILNALFLLIMALLAKTYAKREAVDDLKTEIAGLEARLDAMPSSRELHNLQLEIAELRGDIKAVMPELRQLRRQWDLLLENELKRD